MSYDNFINQVIRYFENYYAETARVSIRKVRKNNGVILDGLVIEKVGVNIAPTIYLNLFYENLDKEENFISVCEQIRHAYEAHALDENYDIRFYYDFEKVRCRIGMKLISKFLNEELLNEIPWMPFLDLAICFFYYLEDFEPEHGMITIRNEHMDRWKITTEELFRVAKENADSLLPVNILTIRELLEKIYSMELPDAPMYVMTNHIGTFGAATILYSNALKQYANLLSSDLYIIPCSIHEVILMPSDAVESAREMNRIIEEVNEVSLCREEVLSDHLYYYSREEDAILNLRDEAEVEN